MSPDYSPKRHMQYARPGMQRGFAIVTAIFLVVILAALGAYMVTTSTTQNIASAQDLQGERAYQAARTGVEWGLYQILQNDVAGGFAASCRAAAPGTFVSPLPLAGYSVNVSCKATSHIEGTRLIGNPLWIYQLTSTATIGAVGAMNYVDRQIIVTLEK